MNTLTYYLKRNVGKLRLKFGFCPMCNSDAPEVYDCPCCNGYQSASGDKWPPPDNIKSKWWKIFTEAIRAKLRISRQVKQSRQL